MLLVDGITILNVGDQEDYDSFQKLDKESEFISHQGFDYRSVNYYNFLEGKIPDLATEKIIIFFFFPFEYWNKSIEYRTYSGMYGNRRFFHQFEYFCHNVTDAIKKHLQYKKVLLIDDPLMALQGRDKRTIMRKLAKECVAVPKQYRVKHIKDILKLLERGHKLYIKPSCGSMGKGISFLQFGDWQTNFGFKDNKIVSRKSDKGWKFHDITGNTTFLRNILKQNIYIEEGIEVLNIKGNKVDLRIYAFFNKIIYIYPRRNKIDEVTTNISQGGVGDPALIDIIPERVIKKAEKTVLEGMKALNLYFAGIDIVIDSALQNTYIVDVNMYPGFPRRKTYNLSRAVITELKCLNREGKLRWE